MVPQCSKFNNGLLVRWQFELEMQMSSELLHGKLL